MLPLTTHLRLESARARAHGSPGQSRAGSMQVQRRASLRVYLAALFDRVISQRSSWRSARLQRVHCNTIEPIQRLRFDLGFDSMSIGLLGSALEDRFGGAILLDDRTAQHSQSEAL